MTVSRVIGWVLIGLIGLAIAAGVAFWLWDSRGMSHDSAIEHCRQTVYGGSREIAETWETGRYENGNWFVYGETRAGEPYFCGMEDSHDPRYVQHWVGDTARDFIAEHAD